MFKLIDQNNDNSLSLGEIWFHIEGAQPTQKEWEIHFEWDLMWKFEVSELFQAMQSKDDEADTISQERMEQVL